MHYVRVRVRGRVQGVGFRYFVLSAGRALALAGVVRNLPDGDVEIEAQGDRERLLELLERARAGPLSARVDDVEVHWAEGARRLPSPFRVE